MRPETNSSADPIQERIYTVAEVAARYRVGPGWVTDHASGKRHPVLPSIKIGKCWRFTEANLADFERHCAALADQIAKRKRPSRVA